MWKNIVYILLCCILAVLFPGEKTSQAGQDKTSNPVPKFLAWNKPLSEKKDFLKYGDLLEIKLITERPFDLEDYPYPDAGLELQIGAITVSLTQEGPATFGGATALSKQGLYVNGKPGELYLVVDDERRSLGRLGDFFLDTVLPTPKNLDIKFVEEDKIQLSWDMDGDVGSETFTIQKKFSSDKIENIDKIDDPEKRTYTVQASESAYRIKAEDRAGNTGATKWKKPLAHSGCFPVFLEGNPTKYRFCHLDTKQKAFIDNYDCQVVDITPQTGASLQYRLVYDCSRFGMTVREEWELAYDGNNQGWTGTMTRKSEEPSEAMPSRETLNVQAWWP